MKHSLKDLGSLIKDQMSSVVWAAEQDEIVRVQRHCDYLYEEGELDKYSLAQIESTLIRPMVHCLLASVPSNAKFLQLGKPVGCEYAFAGPFRICTSPYWLGDTGKVEVSKNGIPMQILRIDVLFE